MPAEPDSVFSVRERRLGVGRAGERGPGWREDTTANEAMARHAARPTHALLRKLRPGGDSVRVDVASS